MRYSTQSKLTFYRKSSFFTHPSLTLLRATLLRENNKFTPFLNNRKGEFLCDIKIRKFYNPLNSN